jgi:hypothetical protein
VTSHGRTRWHPPGMSVSEARPGDIIVYDFDDNGSLNHAGLVVGFASGTQYPEISQWGNVDAGVPGSHPASSAWPPCRPSPECACPDRSMVASAARPLWVTSTESAWSETSAPPLLKAEFE